LGNGKTLADIAEEEGLEVQEQAQATRNEQGVDRQLIEHVFTLARPATEDAVTSSTLLGSNDYALVQLSKVVNADFNSLPEEEKRNIRRTFVRNTSFNEFEAWLNNIQSKATIEYLAGDTPTTDPLF